MSKMNSPYNGDFRVTQIQSSTHDGLDLVGLSDKIVHATVNGVVHYAGWENPSNHSQGFGQYVCVKGADGNFYYYGHLSRIDVQPNKIISCGSPIGMEGSTGYSTGSHCHYCVRPAFMKCEALNVSSISGIPNALGVYNDGFRPASTNAETTAKTIDIKKLQTALNNHGYNCGDVDGICGEKTTAAMQNALYDIWELR